MAADAHEADARLGIQTAYNDHADRGDIRCAHGGTYASIQTPQGVPVIREWEYASGPVIVFSKLDSCLGAIQLTGENAVTGAHFSQLDGVTYDKVNFGKVMKNAGFDSKKPIYYFGGGVDSGDDPVYGHVTGWQEGLGHSIWWKVRGPNMLLFIPTWKDGRWNNPFTDSAKKCWIFQLEGKGLKGFSSHFFAA